MTSNTVVRNIAPLAKDRVKALVAAGLQRVVMQHGMDAVASAAICSPRCVQKALSHDTLPEADKLGNLLLLDPTVFAEWFAALGFRIIPDERAMSPDMQTVSEMSRTVATFITALGDGHRDHRETVEIASLLRPLMPKLSAIVHEADGLRNVA